MSNEINMNNFGLNVSKEGQEYLDKIQGHPELREFCPTCHKDDCIICSNPWHLVNGVQYDFPEPTEEQQFESMFVRAPQHCGNFKEWMAENRVMGIGLINTYETYTKEEILSLLEFSKKQTNNIEDFIEFTNKILEKGKSNFIWPTS